MSCTHALLARMSYCSLTVNPDFDPELASAFNLEVVKAKMNAIKALNLQGQVIDNIMIEYKKELKKDK